MTHANSHKWLVVLIAIVILSALFLASPRGKAFLKESKLDDKVSLVGNYLKSLTDKIKVGEKKTEGKIEFHLTGMDPVYMTGQEFPLKDSIVEATVTLETASISENVLSFKNKEADVFINGVTGDLSFSGDMQISGKTNEIWFDNIGFNKPDTEILLIGTPSQYSIKNVEKKLLTFQEVSGRLTWTGLKTPMSLGGDKLEVHDFEGTIQQRNGLVYIDGYVSYMKLNNIPIGSS